MKGIEEKGREDCSRKTGFLHGSNPIHMFLDRNSKKKKNRENTMNTFMPIIDNPHEMDKFLETHSLQKLNQEEI